MSAQDGGLDAPQAVGAFFNAAFPVTEPGSSTGWNTENAFPNLSFVDPLWLTPVPGSGDFLLVGKDGQIWRFANDPAVTQGQVVSVLDWRTHTQTGEDMGFYQLIFHPNFGQAGEIGENYVYVCYNQKPGLAGEGINDSYWRVSRFTWLSGSGTIDPGSENVFIDQYDPQQWHNGGAMFFDNEGFLNITCGDGEFEHWHQDQNGPIDGGFFGGVFRIDVDYVEALAADPGYSKSHAIRRQPQDIPTGGLARPAGWRASSTQGYGIPGTNPWLDAGGTILEEFIIHGLRSPHTAHYDPVENEIWVGDVGGGAREEIGPLKIGDNAQWPIREGLNGGAEPAGAIGNWTPPLYDYPRGAPDANGVNGQCIIGGMRYRGAKWNALLGEDKVLFGDITQGKVWAATLNPATGALEQIDLLIGGIKPGGKQGIGNICTDDAGEVYFMELNGTNNAGGIIRKLATQGVSSEPPPLLSQTGVFTDLGTLATAPGVIPYTVANPLWSDAAAKQRWIILPNDGSHNSAEEEIVFSEEGNWVFPAGTVLVKHFEVSLDENNPTAVKRLETRFLICTEGGGKYGVTYKWNPAGTDAELLTTGMAESYDVELAGGGTETRNWTYPSRADCLLCHTTAAGQALGVRTTSLNKVFHYDATGRDANQLATFNDLGMFDRTLTTEEIRDFIEARPLDDETAPIEHRVRSYLDSNCSHCHRPGGTIDYFDARLGTPLHVQGLINGVIQGHFSLGPDGRYLKPGDPDLSAAFVRLDNVGNGAAMPPLAKNLIDQEAVDLLQEYLESLTEAEFETTASPQARYVRLTALSEVNGNPWTSVGEFSVLDGDGAAIPVSELSIHDFDSEELVDEFSPVVRVIDGNPDTFWHTEWGAFEPPPPHHVTIDLGSLRAVGGFIYTPRQGEGSQNGRIANYQVDYSTDAVSWTPMDSGTWPNSGAVQRYDGLVGQRKARCEIAGPAGNVAGAFDVTVVFDMDVTDFDAGDVLVTGGSVAALRGKGYYYVATISPEAAQVSVSVPVDAANGGGLGSRASAAVVVDFVDTLPPVPAFTGVPPQVAGSFQIGLTFGEPVSGLEVTDFTVTNATLDSIVAGGNDYVLNLTPLAEGSVGIEIHAAAVVDGAGLPMGAGTSVSVIYSQQVLALNAADASHIGGGMVLVTDAAAPHGQYLWLPEGTDAFNYELPVATQHRAEFTFTVPRAGQWLLRGLIQSSDASSDSFWVEIDGNQALGQVNTWDTGPIGPGYVWDYMNNRNVADPVILDLTAGTHVVTVYARDDGTRLDRLELESIRPLATLVGPAVALNGNFTVAVTFSEAVTGLVAGDFSIAGGSAVGLTGAGASYTLTVAPTAGTVVISLPENTAADAGGALNFASNPVSVTYRTAYEQWAHDHEVDGSAGSLLADDDHDGIEQLLEFAFNLDPKMADAGSYDPAVIPGSGLPRMIVAEVGGTVLSLQFLMRENVPGLGYEAQFGSTLDDFSGAGAVPVEESLGGGWTRVTVADPAPTGQARRFGRVVVTMTPP